MFTEYLFVYGTLRRTAQHPIQQMMLVCADYIKDGQRYTATVYLYNRGVSSLALIESGDFLMPSAAT